MNSDIRRIQRSEEPQALDVVHVEVAEEDVDALRGSNEALAQS